VAALIVNRPSFDHYVLVVLPVLLASLAQPRAAVRSPWIWLALLPLLAGFNLPELTPTKNWAYSVAAFNVTSAAVLLCRAVSHPAAGANTAEPFRGQISTHPDEAGTSPGAEVSLLLIFRACADRGCQGRFFGLSSQR
jgi:hypothetical protein